MTQHRVDGGEPQTQSSAGDGAQSPFDAHLRDVQKFEGLGVLACTVAHDFNNHLTVILGNCSLAQAELDPDSPLRKRLARIHEAARQSALLTQQLLAYSDSSSASPGSLKSIHLPHLLEGIRGLLEMAAGRRCELVIEGPPQLPMIEAEETYLQQLIVNLVTNASESLEHKPGHAWIRFGVERADARDLSAAIGAADLAEGEYVFLEVEDDGSGMPAEVRERIFEPFFTTKQRGRGLGLSAVLGIVRARGGAIWVDSEPGRGTKVRILFPQVNSRG